MYPYFRPAINGGLFSMFKILHKDLLPEIINLLLTFYLQAMYLSPIFLLREYTTFATAAPQCSGFAFQTTS